MRPSREERNEGTSAAKFPQSRKRHLALSIFLAVIIFSPLYGDDCCTWTDIKRIVAVGDIHGDFQSFIKILMGTGLTDNNLNWTGGTDHLVQLGDVMDRGPDARKVFDLLIKLQGQAEKEGGKVHFLMGNHEESNMLGIAFDFAEYITVEQFVSFLPEKVREKAEKSYLKKNRIAEEVPLPLELTEPVRSFWRDQMKNSYLRQKYIDNFSDIYGDWILEQNAVIKINDIVFVHAGISKKFSTWSLKDINKTLKYELKLLRSMQKNRYKDASFRPKIVFQSRGILWYRELVKADEAEMQDEVDKILSNLGAKYMVVGHTPLRSFITDVKDLSRFGGRIWTIDTGISKFYGGYIYALINENGIFKYWGIQNEK